MINTTVFGIFALIMLGGMIYFFSLVTKALKKYINSNKTTTDK